MYQEIADLGKALASIKGTDERSPKDGEADRRLEVHSALHNTPLLLRYSNGNPVLYNRIANSILGAYVGDPKTIGDHLRKRRLKLKLQQKDALSPQATDNVQEPSETRLNRAHDRDARPIQERIGTPRIIQQATDLWWPSGSDELLVLRRGSRNQQTKQTKIGD